MNETRDLVIENREKVKVLSFASAVNSRTGLRKCLDSEIKGEGKCTFDGRGSGQGI